MNIKSIIADKNNRHTFAADYESYAVAFVKGQKHPTNWLIVHGDDGRIWVMPRALGQALIDAGFKQISI